MFFMWFSERAYHYVPEEDPERYRELENEIVRERSFWGTPNRFVGRGHCAKLLNEYIDERVYSDSELMNFDGVMLNEHHATRMCLGSVMDVEAAVLARATQRVKIVLLGNPVATTANPLRLSEELAMIDMISGGRLAPGWVRGFGTEQLANNANPALNLELFRKAIAASGLLSDWAMFNVDGMGGVNRDITREALDIILRLWSEEAEFDYAGKFWHVTKAPEMFGLLHPHLYPVQRPHPPIASPGCRRTRIP